jgi:hypothetical protein
MVEVAGIELAFHIDISHSTAPSKSKAKRARHNELNLSNLKARGLSFKVGKPKAQSHN